MVEDIVSEVCLLYSSVKKRAQDYSQVFKLDP